MIAKIQIKYNSIHDFEGFFFCIDHFRNSGLAEIIDNALGIKSVLMRYSYSEKVETLMSIYLTEGSRIEDAKRLSTHFSEKTQGHELCSPDTVLKMLSDNGKDIFWTDRLVCAVFHLEKEGIDNENENFVMLGHAPASQKKTNDNHH